MGLGSMLWHLHRRFYSTAALKPPWNVLFFGTDNFSLESLKTLHMELQNSGQIIRRLEVVTSNKNNCVGKYAENHAIVIQHWPLQMCKQFDIGVVVSFGHLIQKSVIESFPMGIINVHASLLPRWRGAAPIIHALAAGDEKTGVTIMKIQPHKFDVGEIIHQEEVEISEEVRMPELHALLSRIGARNLLHVLRNSPGILDTAKPQDKQIATFAPRVNSSMANVNLEVQSAKTLYNLSRALYNLYPLVAKCNGTLIKLHSIVQYSNQLEHHTVPVGSIVYDKRSNTLQIAVHDGWIYVDKIGMPGKKVMNALEFRNGYLKNKKAVLITTAYS